MESLKLALRVESPPRAIQVANVQTLAKRVAAMEKFSSSGKVSVDTFGPKPIPMNYNKGVLA